MGEGKINLAAVIVGGWWMGGFVGNASMVA